MDLGIAGKHAVVCASSRGLGRACAFSLAEAGCSVVVNGRDEAKLEATAQALRDATGAEVTAVAGDVTEESTRERLVAVRPVDILVNNAAGPPLADFRQLNEAALLKGLDANMVTPIAMIQLVIDGMTERGFGRIINITSSSVLAAIEGLDLSSGARAGLTGFLSGVSRQVAGSNVAINNLLPGSFDTDRQSSIIALTAEKTGRSVEEICAARDAANPTGRIGSPEEFGAACAFLASQHAGFIIGQNILMDGGATRANF
ncbi:3-oxoacyl-[acyl-carrier protein] reductase [Altererythrobacter xiamenensis]|uniref:3-oxoacyl-[acyl-carrier protein] reductase n=1 Tax=Altererythrobacter xiamenensis TaxID=1316679 RepID=A0A1Y6ECG4_9SPHN|nr:SDR family oxidoreductase [Altererythrobacter xiamenensis]SMQ58302.1 3-oxoacyl-[acyl-carrier protein] reductase [Altererythrobacter xiamenensis]